MGVCKKFGPVWIFFLNAAKYLCQLGHGVSSNLLVQNYLDFIKKMNGLQENCFILWIDIAWDLQKLGIMLENKVTQNLELQNMTFVRVVLLS